MGSIASLMQGPPPPTKLLSFADKQQQAADTELRTQQAGLASSEAERADAQTAGFDLQNKIQQRALAQAPIFVDALKRSKGDPALFQQYALEGGADVGPTLEHTKTVTDMGDKMAQMTGRQLDNEKRINNKALGGLDAVANAPEEQQGDMYATVMKENPTLSHFLPATHPGKAALDAARGMMTAHDEQLSDAQKRAQTAEATALAAKNTTEVADIQRKAAAATLATVDPANPDSYKTWLDANPSVKGVAPPVYSPQWAASFIRSTVAAQAQPKYDQEQAANLSGPLKQARTVGEYEAIRTRPGGENYPNLSAYDPNEELDDSDRAAVDRAALTPMQTTTSQATAARNANTAMHQKVLESLSAQRLGLAAQRLKQETPAQAAARTKFEDQEINRHADVQGKEQDFWNLKGEIGKALSVPDGETFVDPTSRTPVERTMSPDWRTRMASAQSKAEGDALAQQNKARQIRKQHGWGEFAPATPGAAPGVQKTGATAKPGSKGVVNEAEARSRATAAGKNPDVIVNDLKSQGYTLK
jgi:hypothetical protein